MQSVTAQHVLWFFSQPAVWFLILKLAATVFLTAVCAHHLWKARRTRTLLGLGVGAGVIVIMTVVSVVEAQQRFAHGVTATELPAMSVWWLRAVGFFGSVCLVVAAYLVLRGLRHRVR